MSKWSVKEIAEFDFEVRLLRYEMECKMTAKDRKRVEARAKKLARSARTESTGRRKT